MSPPKTRFIFDVPSSNPAPPSRREALSCRAVAHRRAQTRERASGYRIRNPIARLGLAFCATLSLPFRSIEWLGLFRLLAVRVAYSRRRFAVSPPMQASNAMQRNATQCNAIGLHLHLHHPLSHTAQASSLTSLTSLTSPASPASPHLAAHLSNVSPFSSVPRLAHFAEKDSLFRDTRQSLACRTHAPSQPPHEHPRP